MENKKLSAKISAWAHAEMDHFKRDRKYRTFVSVLAVVILVGLIGGALAFPTSSWVATTSNNCSPQFGGNTMVEANGWIYVMANSTTPRFRKYNPATGDCLPTTLADPGSATDGANMVAVDVNNDGTKDVIYFHTGSSGNSQIYLYDIATDEWIFNTRAKANDSTTGTNQMAQPSSVAQGDGNSIVNVGGTFFVMDTSFTFRKYTPGTNTWTNLTGTNVNPGTTLTAAGTKVYAFMGAGATPFWSFDTTQTPGSWTTLAAAPAAVNIGGALTTVGNEIYAFRGGNSKDFWRYDVTNNRWNNVADGQIPVSAPDIVGAGAALVYPGSGNYIYAFQGGNTKNFWRYDTVANSWDSSTLAKAPFRIASGGSMTSDGTDLYATRGNGTKDFWKYTVDINPSNPGTWTTLPETPVDVGVIYTTTSSSNRGGIAYTSSGPSGGGEIYLVSGNATTSNNYGYIFRYPLTGTNANRWPEVTLPGPLPATVAYGASMAYPGVSAEDPTGDFLYFLRGLGGANFWKFSLSKNEWIPWNRAKTTVNGNPNVPISQNTPSSAGSFVQGNGNAIAEVNGKFYVLQGNGSKRFHRYDSSTNTWVALADAPNFVTTGGSLVKIDNNTLYAFMGAQGTSPVPNQEFWKYDIPSDTWIAFNIGRRESDGAIFDNSGASQGNGNSVVQVNGEFYVIAGLSSTTFEKYNPVTNTWSSLGLPTTAFSGTAMVAAGTDIYVIFGQNAGTYYKYDTLANTWTSRTSMPAGTPSWSYVGAGGSLAYPGSGDFIYAFKGFYAGNTQPNRQFWRYSISGNSWTQMADAPQTVGGGAALTGVNGDPNTIYALGGEYTTNFWRYNIPNNRWNDPADGMVPSPAPGIIEAGGALTSDGTFVYVTQGGFKKTVWKYVPVSTSWVTLPDAPAKIGQPCTTSNGRCTNALGGLTYYNDATNGGVWLVTGNSITGVNTNQSSSDPDYRGDIYRFNTATNSWPIYDRPAQAPAAVGQGASLTYPGSGNFIYAVKGGGSSSKDFWLYDMSANQWRALYQSKKDDGTVLSQNNYIPNTSTRVSTSSNQGAGTAIAEVNGIFYILEGNSTKTFHKYDPSANTWTQLADTPNTIGSGAALVKKDGNTLYALSGSSWSTSNFWRYDIPTDSWIAFNMGKNDSGAPFSQSGSNQSTGNIIVQLNGDMYVLAGGSQVFEKYTPSTNTWTVLDNSPVSISDGASMVAIGTNIYMEPGSCFSTSCFYKYDTLTNSWTPNMSTTSGGLRSPPLSWGTGAALVYPGSGDYIFALRGATTATFWKYCFQSSGSTPSATVCNASQVGYWSGQAGPSPAITTPAVSPATVAGGGSMTSIGSNIYAFGGNNTTNFWRYNITNDRWNNAVDGEVPDSTLETVQAGGALSTDGTYVYAMKGSNTTMFWRYDPAAASGNRWVHIQNVPEKAGTAATSSAKGGLTFYSYLDGGGGPRQEIWAVTGNGRNGFSLSSGQDPEQGGLIFRYSISGGPTPGTWTYFRGTANMNGPFGGSSLTYPGSGDLIYAFNANGNFMMHDMSLNEWNMSNKGKLESGKPISQTFVPEITYGNALQGEGNSMVRVGSKFYMLEGNSTQIFESYDPGTNTWTRLENTPATVSTGSTLISTDNDTIFAFRGGTTNAFWKYTISNGHWTTMATTLANVGAGGSLVYPGSGNYIYAFQGAASTAFWRYDISLNSWSAAGATPAAVNGGGHLVYPGSGNFIYAFQGSGTTAFWRYDVTTAWPPAGANWTTTLTAAPAATGSGASLASDGADTIYATRGNGTTDFWTYSIAGNTWTILGAPKTTPVVVGSASTTTSKGDIVYVPGSTYTGQSSGGEIFMSPGTAVNGNTTSTTGALYRYATSGTNAGTWPLLLALPAPPASVSNGGSLTYPGSGNWLYAFQGSGTTSFWKYNLNVNEWNTSVRGKLDNDDPISNNGATQGIGNSIVAVNLKLYILAGGGTTFQQYDPSTNRWTTLEALPASAGDGAAMVSTDTDTIYALRGGTTANSYVYKISTGHWTALGNTPGNITAGGSLGYPGSGNYIYALQGGSQVMYKYDITQGTPGTWATVTQSTLIGTAQGGASMIGISGSLYAVRGGNTGNFYKFTVTNAPAAGDGGWAALTAAPWNILAGGSLTTNGAQIWATRGGATAQIRKYCTVTDADCTAGSWAAADIAAFPTNIGTAATSSDRGGIVLIDPCTPLTSCAVLYGVPGLGVNANASGSVGLLFRYPFTGTYANTWPVTVNAAQSPSAINGGGSLTSDGSGTLYATRGANTGDFMKYTIATNAWTALNSFPFGFGTTSTSQGGIAYTGSGPSGNEIFAVTGTGMSGMNVPTDTNQNVISGVYQGTPGRGLIFRYPLAGANANTWPMTNTPPLAQLQVGATTYDEGPGGGITSVGTNVYALQGNSTLNFLKYNITNSPNPGDGTWSTLTAMTAGAATASYGGALTNDGTNIYATKGNNTAEFYRYNILGNSWTLLGTPPVTMGTGSTVGSLTYASAGPSGGPEIFMIDGRGTNSSTDTYGNNYNGLLYHYNIGGDNWPFDYEAADFAASTNAFYGGSDLASTPDGTTIYALRGSNTSTNPPTGANPNFWKYTVSGNSKGTWTAMTNLPNNISPQDIQSGGSLVSTDNNTLYASRGKGTTDFYKYDIGASTWSAQSAFPVNVGSVSTSADAGELAYAPTYGALFATPGNDTASPYTIYKYGLSRLVITSVIKTGGGTPIVGQSMDLTVQRLDPNDSPITSGGDVQFSISLKTGSGVLSGTSTGTILNGSSTATITGVLYSMADGNVVLTATDVTTPANAITLAAGDSDPFSVNPAAPQVSSVSPNSGPTGGRTVVAVNSSGNNFYSHYIKPVTINSATALTDYQTAITVDTASLITAGKMRSDCGDVRFTTTTGTTPYSSNLNQLNYWLDTNTCNTAATKFWVKIPTINVGNNTIYLYYGDFRLSSASNGDNTFVFFDDFTGTTFNTTKWTKLDSGNNISQNGKIVIAGGGTPTGFYSNTNFNRSSSLQMEMDFKPTSCCSTIGFGWKDTTATLGSVSTAVGSGGFIHAFNNNSSSSDDVYEGGTSSNSDGSQSWTQNQQYKIRLVMVPGPTNGAIYQRSMDGGNTWINWKTTTTRSDASAKVAITNNFQASEIDNVVVRQYTATEPTATFGNETPTIGVTFGGSSAIVTSFGANALNVIPPQHTAGVVDVVVTNADNQTSTLTGGYTYVAPAITSIVPDNGLPAGGTSVTITGTNFLPTKFNMPVTITNGSIAALTDYQVAVTMDTATLIAEGKMRSDGGDIRVLDSDFSTPINNLWVENINSANTKVWVKVPSIPSMGSKTIYVTYGDGSLPPISSTTNTFIREIDSGSLKAKITMDEASGYTAADQSGNGNNGSARNSSDNNNGTTITTGKFNNARHFDGSGEFVKVPAISIPSDITVSAWVKASSFGGSMFVVQKRPVNAQWEIFFESGLLLWRGASTTSISCSSSLLTANQWNNIVATQTGTTATLYVNGNQCATGTVTAIANTGTQIDIGRHDSGYYFNGDIDDVAIYNRVLSAPEISDIANNYSYATPNYPGKTLIKKFQGLAATPQTEAVSTSNGAEVGMDIPVTFDTSTASVSDVTSDSITLLTPVHIAATVPVTVTNAGDNATATTNFIYGVPPDVTSVVPNQGSIFGGDTVDVFGTDFSNTPDPSHPGQNLEVFFGANLATPVNFIDSTHLTVTTPAGATTGAVNVRVVNPNTQSDILTNGFTYITITDPTNSTVVASPLFDVEDDGIESSTVTVTLLDNATPTPNPANDKTVQLAATSVPGGGAAAIDAVDCTTGNSLNNVPPEQAVTGADGKACFKVRTFPASARGVSGAYTFTATDITAAPITVTQTATVTFVDLIANKTNSTFTAPAGNVVADNVATKLLTATILNKNNVAVDANNVTVNQISGPGTATVTPVINPTNASGVATFTVSTTTAGTYTFQATASTGVVMDDAGDTVTVVFVAGPVSPNPPISRFFSDITTLAADNAQTAQFTAVLRDQYNNPVIDQTLNFNQTSGPSAATITPVFCPVPEPPGSANNKSNVNGHVCARVQANQAGTYSFEATDSSTFTLSETVTLTFTGPTQTDSTITRYPATVAANGLNSSTVIVTLTDATSHIFTGRTVTLTKSPGIATQGIDAVDCSAGTSLGTGNSTTSDANGQACFKATSTVRGTFNYQAVNTTEGSPTLSASVSFVEGPVWATNGQVIANAQDDNSTYYTPSRTKLVQTSDGNYITIWFDDRNGAGTRSLYAQKYNNLGAPQWTPSTGVNITNGSGTNYPYESQIITDGGTGAFVTWLQYNPTSTKIELLGQHVSSTGSFLWGGGSPLVILNATTGDSIASPDGNGGYTIIADGAGGAFIGYRDYNLANYQKTVTRINSSGSVVTGDVAAWPVTLGIGSTCTGSAAIDLTLVRAGVVLVAYPDESDQLPYCVGTNSDTDIHMTTLNSIDPADFIWEGGPLNTRDNVYTDPDYAVYNCLYTNPVHGWAESKLQWAQRIITDGAGGAYTITKDDCHSGLTGDDYMVYVHYTSNSAAGPLYMWNYQLGQYSTSGTAHFDVIPDGAGGVIIMYTAEGQNGQVYIQRITNNTLTQAPDSLWNGGTRLAVSNIGSNWKLMPGPNTGSAYVILPETTSAGGTKVILYNADGTIAAGYPKHIHNWIDSVPGVYLGTVYESTLGQQRNAVSDGAGGFVFVGEGTTNGFISAPFIYDTDNFIQHVTSSGILEWTSASDVEVSPGVDVQSIADKDQQEEQAVRLNDGNTIVVWRDNAKQQAFGSTYLGNINAINNGGFVTTAEKLDPNGNPVWNTAGTGRGRILFYSDGTNDTNNDQLSIAADQTTNAQNGGALVAWRRTQSSSYPSIIYVQKINSTYDNYWLNWPANYYSGTPTGTALTPPGQNNSNPTIVSDGNGGGYVTWISDSGGSPNSDVIVARVNATNGNYDATWGSTYKNVTNTNTLVESNPRMVRASGYLSIAYEQDNTGSGRAHDLYAARINETNGTTWANGIIATGIVDERLKDILADGAGGVYILYTDNGGAGGKQRVMAQHLDSNLNRTWNMGGVVVSSSPNDNLNARMATDDNNGLLIAWEQYDAAGTASDIAIQRIDSLGAKKWNDGLIISDSSQAVLKLNPRITRDGANSPYPTSGAVITWDQANVGGTANYVYSQHVVNSIPQWNTNGLQVTNVAARFDQSPLILGDDNGGGVLTWQGHSSPPDIFGQTILEGDHAYNSTFTRATAINPVANGTDTELVTATLLDQAGLPAPGRTITVNAILGNPSSTTITPTVCATGGTAGVTNASGEACYLISAIASGTFTYAATDTTDINNFVTITPTVNITFDPMPPTAANSTLVADPITVTADGTTTSALTVTLLDANNNPVPGKTVTVAQTGGPGTPTITATAVGCLNEIAGVSDINGHVCFTVSSTTTGTDTFQATDTTDNVVVTQTADVTFTPGAPSAATSTFTALPTSVVSDGVATSTLTATVRDAYSNLVPGATVSVRKTSANAGTPTIVPITATTNGSGVATFTVSNTTAGTDTYAASLDDVTLPAGFSEQSVTHVVPGTGGTWTAVTPSNTDDGTATVALPFTFSYFGSNYTTAYMCTNGYIQFVDGAGSCSYQNSSFGSGDGIPRIAAYFQDLLLNTGSGGVMEYQTTANSIRFHWNIGNCCSGTPVNHDFEIDLFNDNHIEYHYNDTSAETGNVVGVDSGAASTACTDTNFCIRSTLSGTNITTQSTQFAAGAGGHPDIAQTADVTYYVPLPPPSICGFTQVSSGYQSSYALRSNGTVWAWGLNGLGQLGDGTYNNSDVPVQVSGLTNVIYVAGGDDHGLALKNDGTVWAWGPNYAGQLGDGTNNDSNVPVQVSGLTNVTAIAGGVAHSLAIKNDGTVWAWGDDQYGQLGNGAYIDSNVPVQVTDPGDPSGYLQGVTAVSAGDLFSMALKGNGTVWTFGYGTSGLLGNGTTPANSNVPVQATITNVTAISGKDLHALALKNDGTVWGWGSDINGELGDGNNTGIVSTPVQTSITNVSSIIAAYGHSLAIKTDGTLWTWGFGTHGQLGNGGILSSNVPVEITALPSVISITGGYENSLAIQTDGTVWAWGRNLNGELGNGTTTQSAVPVAVQGGQPSCIVPDNGPTAGGTNVTIYGLNFQPVGTTTVTFDANPATAVTVVNANTITATTPAHAAGPVNVTVTNPDAQSTTFTNGFTYVPPPAVCGPAAADFTQIDGGYYHALGIKTGGTVWAWGKNTHGELGNNTTTESHNPVQVPGLTNVTAVSANSDINDAFSLALKSDGTVWSWGANTQGELGRGNNIESHVPVQVSGLTGVTAISAGGSHSLALKSDGTVWAWGGNLHGVLGNGNTTNSNIPIQVTALTGTAISIGTGATHSLAALNDGTVWAWGLNDAGQLGDGTNTESQVPVQVSGLTGITDVSGGSTHSLAIKNDTTVWAWGNGTIGQLGNGANSSSNVPVQVSGLTGITKISGGLYHSMALKNDNTVWTWGGNGAGELGDGTNTNSNVPVPVGLTGITNIGAGQWYSTAVKNNGTSWAWGANDHGQLGDGTTTGTNAPAQIQRLACIDPNVGPTTGGTNVTITGSDFQTTGTTAVTFDGIPATGVTVVNATTITATTPAHAVGPVNVTVTNPDSQTATLTNGFTYQSIVNAGSTITAFPTSVAGDGVTASRITVTLLNLDTSPAVGHNVTIFRNSGPGTEVITPVVCASGFAPAGTTNPVGEACFDVTSTSIGFYNFGATDTTDSVTLTSTVDIEFTCAVGSAGVLSGTGGEQCAVIGITPNTGSLSIIKIPDSFSFPASFPGGSSFNNGSGADDADRVIVSDTRNSSGFTLQLQATTTFADIGNPLHTIPLNNLYVATTTVPNNTRVPGLESNPNAIACNGIEYLGPAYNALPDCSTLPDAITAQFNVLSPLNDPLTYNTLTGNTLGGTVDLMQTASGHNGTFSQLINYYLTIPSTQDIGSYQVTLTFTAL